jgi:hypothetical protein
MRKVHVKLIVDAFLHIDEGVDLGEAIQESELHLKNDSDRITVINLDIDDYEVTDSR